MSVFVSADQGQRSLSESLSSALSSMSHGATRTASDPGAALNQFLLGVEQRAFAMTVLAVRDREDALDIVQDAMLQLAEKYGNRPRSEWAPLFFRILKNRTTDYHRRNTRSRGIFGWFDRARDNDDGDVADPLLEHPGSRVHEPAVRLASDGSAEAISAAVRALPGRQREAFLLRSWEGLDVAATAEVMGCSQGSVKTHHFRALAALRQQLGDHWIDQEPDS